MPSRHELLPEETTVLHEESEIQSTSSKMCQGILDVGYEFAFVN